MLSLLTRWVSPLIEAAKDKISLLVLTISPKAKQNISPCQNVNISAPLQITSSSILAKLFGYRQSPFSDIEKGKEDITASRFLWPKAWLGARLEQTRQSCTTIPSFYVREATKADDEWHIRYRRDVLGCDSPRTQPTSRIPSTALPQNGVQADQESSPSSNSNEDTSACSPTSAEVVIEESDVADELITPPTSSDLPSVFQIFTPRLSDTPTIDNLALELLAPFTPDGSNKPMPVDTDPYDLMSHLFGHDFVRMDNEAMATFLATNEMCSTGTDSVGLAIGLALSNESTFPCAPERFSVSRESLSQAADKLDDGNSGDVLLDLPLFLAMSEQENLSSEGASGDSDTPSMEVGGLYSSPDISTSSSSPELITPLQTPDNGTLSSVYSRPTLDGQVRDFFKAIEVQKGTSIKRNEQPAKQARQESGVGGTPDAAAKQRRHGGFMSEAPALPRLSPPCMLLPILLPMPSSSRFRGGSSASASPALSLRGKLSANLLPIGKSTPQRTLAEFQSRSRAGSLRPSKSLETVTARAKASLSRPLAFEPSPFSRLNRSLPSAAESLSGHSAFKNKYNSRSSTRGSQSPEPSKSFLLNKKNESFGQHACPIKISGSLSLTTYHKSPSASDVCAHVYRANKHQKRKYAQNPRLSSVAEQIEPQDGTAINATDSPLIWALSSDADDGTKTQDGFSSLASSLSSSPVSPPGFVFCPLISVSPPSVSSICLDDFVSVSVCDSSLLSVNTIKKGCQLSSICTLCAQRMSPSMSSQHLRAGSEQKNTAPGTISSGSHTGPTKRTRRNMTINSSDDLESSFCRTLADVHTKNMTLSVLTSPTREDVPSSLPALEDILVVNENYVSGLALPEILPLRRVSAPSAYPSGAPAPFAACSAPFGGIRHSGSNVSISRRQSALEPQVGDKSLRRPLFLAAKTGNRTSTLKPLVLPMKLALREANEENARLSSRLVALGSSDPSYEASSSSVELNGSGSSSSSATTAPIEPLDDAGVTRSPVPPPSSSGSSSSPYHAWGVPF